MTPEQITAQKVVAYIPPYIKEAYADYINSQYEESISSIITRLLRAEAPKLGIVFKKREYKILSNKRRAVICLTDDNSPIIAFRSLAETSIFFKVYHTKISYAISHNSLALGYKFKYAE